MQRSSWRSDLRSCMTLPPPLGPSQSISLCPTANRPLTSTSTPTSPLLSTASQSVDISVETSVAEVSVAPSESWPSVGRRWWGCLSVTVASVEVHTSLTDVPKTTTLLLGGRGGSGRSSDASRGFARGRGRLCRRRWEGRFEGPRPGLITTDGTNRRLGTAPRPSLRPSASLIQSLTILSASLPLPLPPPSPRPPPSPNSPSPKSKPSASKSTLSSPSDPVFSRPDPRGAVRLRFRDPVEREDPLRDLAFPDAWVDCFDERLAWLRPWLWLPPCLRRRCRSS